eukprot:SAG11_NODE_1063_length_5996_cov_2.201798_3_plen_205_part_00
MPLFSRLKPQPTDSSPCNLPPHLCHDLCHGRFHRHLPFVAAGNFSLLPEACEWAVALTAVDVGREGGANVTPAPAPEPSLAPMAASSETARDGRKPPLVVPAVATAEPVAKSLAAQTAGGMSVQAELDQLRAENVRLRGLLNAPRTTAGTPAAGGEGTSGGIYNSGEARELCHRTHGCGAAFAVAVDIPKFRFGMEHLRLVPAR